MRLKALGLAWISEQWAVGSEPLLPPTAHRPLSPMQLTHAAFITRRWYAEKCVASRSEPVVEDGTKFRERPKAHDGSEPLPTWQHPHDLNPGEVTFVPTPIRRSDVHLLGHLFVRMRRRAIQILRIVVIEPFKPPIAIEGLDTFARPAAKVALAVGVNFDLVVPSH